MSYQYDAAGNRTRLQWPDGYYATYGYDALNHPTTVVDSDGTTLATYLYDDLARRASLQYSGTSGAKLLYSWSSENDLLTLTNDFAGTAADVAFTNTFSPAHQWLSASVSNSAYVSFPNPTATVPFASDNLNQYTAVDSLAFTSDARGNTTSSYVLMLFDAENRMVRYGNGGKIVLSFDGAGRRTAKTVAGVVTSFLHDGDSEIAEYDGAGNLLRRFVPGPSLNDYIAMESASGVKTFFHTDKMGSVVAMSDTAGNRVEGPYVYDPFGACWDGAVPCKTGVPFRFTGQRRDPEMMVMYFHGRNYFPALGRFMQTDPIGYKDDLDLYTYVGNDPTDRTDPTGMVDDVTGGRWADQAELNTPEARQGAMGAVSVTITAVGTYMAPEKVTIGTVVGGAVSGGISAAHGDSSSQIISNIKAGAYSGATTSAGGAIGGKGGALAHIAGEATGAYTAAKASGADDRTANISAGVAATVGTIFQFTPGLAPSADPAASASGAATRTFLKSILKSGVKGEVKRDLAHPQNAPNSGCPPQKCP